jgi:hypothetical protein
MEFPTPTRQLSARAPRDGRGLAAFSGLGLIGLSHANRLNEFQSLSLGDFVELDDRLRGAELKQDEQLHISWRPHVLLKIVFCPPGRFEVECVRINNVLVELTFEAAMLNARGSQKRTKASRQLLIFASRCF